MRTRPGAGCCCETPTGRGGVVFRGRRYDTGDRGDYLRAIVRLACEREDLGPDFRPWPRGYVAREL